MLYLVLSFQILIKTSFQQIVPNILLSKENCKKYAYSSLKPISVENHCVLIKSCKFQRLTQIKGGACHLSKSNTTIINSIFDSNSAEFGGSLYGVELYSLSINNTYFIRNSADRFSSIYSHGKEIVSPFSFDNSNISFSNAKIWVSGIYYYHCLPFFSRSFFSNSYSPNYGMLFDWTSTPAKGQYLHNVFKNLSSETEGAAFTAFHWLHQSVFNGCSFLQLHGKQPTSIYIYSRDSIIHINDCVFDPDSIGCRFNPAFNSIFINNEIFNNSSPIKNILTVDNNIEQ